MPREQRRAREEHGREENAERGRERKPERAREEHGREREPERARARKQARPRRERSSQGIGARDAALSAARQVQELTGRDPEGVTSLERREDGWVVGIEVVETHRVPDSTDILAEYRVEVDNDGELLTYRRDHRYYRGRSEERT
ncbi:gas vesicle protein GvpO [Streptomyces coffeae]|uniref:Gas vesicle protein n=1 Tax=Streptomyces coffeae TaxID=621382 RepID=A0ABS1NJG2_9ACTN|nr:gas vesicle protein GvpO [Streptomyces coffeae]MBL1100249.1 gas vesicle protein [Streptomyces coffeae]